MQLQSLDRHARCVGLCHVRRLQTGLFEKTQPAIRVGMHVGSHQILDEAIAAQPDGALYAAVNELANRFGRPLPPRTQGRLPRRIIPGLRQGSSRRPPLRTRAKDIL